MISMLRMGARLSLAGGRTSVVALIVTTTAVAIGTAIMLFALSFEPALQSRYARVGWRNSYGDDSALTADSLYLRTWTDMVAGQEIAMIQVAAGGPDAPLPNGLASWPADGHSYVSPALAALLATLPADQLRDRFGQVMGTIGTAALKAPNELAVVIGRPASELRAQNATAITQLNAETQLPRVGFLISLLAAIAAAGALTPVVVFVATATRLTAATRERRLALLRLVGATPRQLRFLGAGESVSAMVPGAVLGALLFFAARPFVASLQIDGLDWFPEAVSPPLPLAALALIAVPVMGVGSALLGLRRINISPLGAVREQRRGRPRILRLAILAAAWGAFGLALAILNDRAGRTEAGVVFVAAAFIGLIVGVAVAGPWITHALGSLLGWIARGPAGLLASRRLTQSPGGAFGAVSGVVMAVLVASAFSVVLGYMSVYANEFSPSPDHDRLNASFWGTPLTADREQAMQLAIAAVPGFAWSASVRSVDLIATPAGGSLDDSDVLDAWVIDCADANLIGALHLDCGVHQLWVRTAVRVDLKDTIQLSQCCPGPDLDPTTVSLPVVRSFGRFQVTDSTSNVPSVIVDAGLLGDDVRVLRTTSMVISLPGLATPSVERIRTSIVSAAPGAFVRTVPESMAESTGVVGELGRLVMLGTLATLMIAGCSLAVSVAAGLLDRRRPLALLRLTGMSLGRLRQMVLLEAGTPLVVIAILSAVLGVLAGEAILQTVAIVPIPMPDLGFVPVVVIGLLGAMLVVAATLPLLSRVTATESTRFE